MEIIKIGVISDTHIPSRATQIPKRVMDGLSKVDYILHAGDINSESVIYELEELAPVYMVAGNTDSYSLAEKLSYKKIIEIGGLRLGLTHGHIGTKITTLDRVKELFKNDYVNCVVFGHSHSPLNQLIDNILYFNPGSPTDKRRETMYSYGILTIKNQIIEGNIVRF